MALCDMPSAENQHDMHTTLDALWQECRTLGHLDPGYVTKQLHRIPAAPVVDRVAYIVERCQGKRVLNLGCASGTLHSEINKVSKAIYGVDILQGISTWMVCDLDRHPEQILPSCAELGIDIIVAGETLEHLANPGNLLEVLRVIGAPLLVSVPNAFSDAGRHWLLRGYENVHRDHFAWYSWHTLKALLERSHFQVTDCLWYNGHPYTAEGLIMRAT